MITSKFNELSPSTYVNLLSDSGFKAVYLDKSNKNLLIELLNCILPSEARVRDIESYEDRERDADVIGGKRTYLDLVCVGEDGRRFAVEIQKSEEAAFFERCIYYANLLLRLFLLSSRRRSGSRRRCPSAAVIVIICSTGF